LNIFVITNIIKLEVMDLRKKSFIKKVINILLSVVFVLFIGGNMFYCFIAGAPNDRGTLIKYVFNTAMFSLLLPGIICGCLFYIRYLHGLIDEMNKI